MWSDMWPYVGARDGAPRVTFEAGRTVREANEKAGVTMWGHF
jgi:hypothetical protein